MNLLLDTHIFIWWDSQPGQLSQQALSLCQDAGNTLFLSLVSVWEMQIKNQLGKLQFNRPLAELIANQQKTNGLQILPVQLQHIYALDALEMHHKDPFDRLLVAQAQTENMVLVSVDPIFAQYPVTVQG